MGNRDRSDRPRSAGSLGTRPIWWTTTRGRWARWGLAAALAAGTALLVVAQSRDAAETLAGMGSLRSVAVSRRELAPGHTVTGGDVTVRRLPLAAIPSGAMASDSVGRIVTARVVAGEVMNSARLAPEGRTGLSALVPPGWRGVSIPRPGDGPGLSLQVGDVVDVLAAGDGVIDRRGAAVARGARVIAIGDRNVTVAVRGEEIARVAGVLGAGVPVLAVVGPDPDP